MIRATIVGLYSALCVSTVATAQTVPDEPSFAAAAEADARTEYARAAVLYERFAGACLASSTAVLEAPCEDLPRALDRGFELARALGDAAAAERFALAFVDHLLYARPREALRIGYRLARMHLEASRLEQADATLERWVALHADPPAGLAILLDSLRARIAHAMDRPRHAAALWRRAERRYELERDQIDPEGAVPPELVREMLAEGRLLRAERSVARFLGTGAPRVRGARDREELWTRVLTPWRVRVERRLLLARMELERVYELGSPRHSVIAAARIGQMYGHYAELHAGLSIDDAWLRTWVRHGEDRPGYDQARAHLETCIAWASHHGVAHRWARTCQEELSDLDSASYPVPAELHPSAAYFPVSTAAPPELR